MSRLADQIAQRLTQITGAISGTFQRVTKITVSKVVRGLDAQTEAQTRGKQGVAAASDGLREPEPRGAPTGDLDPGHDMYRARRQALFFEKDPEKQEAARARFLNELTELVERGDEDGADKLFERVTGLPEYKGRGKPIAERKINEFTIEGLDLQVGGKWGNNPHITPPEPSRMKSLLEIRKAMDLSPQDVLVDIGSGTGKAITFFRLFTPAKKVIGIEIEPNLAAFANRHATELGLKNVHTENRDALEGPLPEDATAVYFYEPFLSVDKKDAVGTFADTLTETGESKPLQVMAKSKDLANRLEESDVFSLKGEYPYEYQFKGQVKTNSWYHYTSG